MTADEQSELLIVAGVTLDSDHMMRPGLQSSASLSHDSSLAHGGWRLGRSHGST